MKTFIIKSLALLVVIILSNCSRDKYCTYTVIADRFIEEYAVVDGIELFQQDDSVLSISFIQNDDYYSKKKLPHLYDKLSEKHSDMGWNLKHQYMDLVNLNRSCSAKAAHIDFVSISVTSDKEFCSSLPNPRELNDIVRFMSCSPYKFIKTRYTTPYIVNQKEVSKEFLHYVKINDLYWLYGGYFRSHWRAEAVPFYPIEKKCSELTSSDLFLLWLSHPGKYYREGFASLYFEQTPDIAGDYEITVEMVGDDGVTYKATKTVTFR